MAPKLIGYEQAEAITGIKRGTLAAMVCRQQIPFVRLAPRIVRFDEAELIAWIDERRVEVA